MGGDLIFLIVISVFALYYLLNSCFCNKTNEGFQGYIGRPYENQTCLLKLLTADTADTRNFDCQNN